MCRRAVAPAAAPRAAQAGLACRAVLQGRIRYPAVRSFITPLHGSDHNLFVCLASPFNLPRLACQIWTLLAYVPPKSEKARTIRRHELRTIRRFGLGMALLTSHTVPTALSESTKRSLRRLPSAKPVRSFICRRRFVLKAIAATHKTSPKPLRVEHPYNEKIAGLKSFFCQSKIIHEDQRIKLIR